VQNLCDRDFQPLITADAKNSEDFGFNLNRGLKPHGVKPRGSICHNFAVIIMCNSHHCSSDRCCLEKP